MRETGTAATGRQQVRVTLNSEPQCLRPLTGCKVLHGVVLRGEGQRDGCGVEPGGQAVAGRVLLPRKRAQHHVLVACREGQGRQVGVHTLRVLSRHSSASCTATTERGRHALYEQISHARLQGKVPRLPVKVPHRCG